ncbi:MAG: FAD-binding oxidoreductase [Chloroflexota bacterium]|nr:FAD-binding oxidoreductase [Chloroflexota bacterium]
MIVGAGVVGAALAYAASRRGLEVTVLEQAPGAARGGTRWSMGGASWLTWAGEPRLRDLCREGLDHYRLLSDELGTGCGFRPLPMVVLAPDDAALDRLASLLNSARPHGFSGRIVPSDELRDLEPALAPDAAVGAAICEQGRLDTVTLTEAWLTVAAQLGAIVRYGVEVHAVHQAGVDRAVVRTGEGLIAADRVVVAAGAWTRRLLRASGRDVAVLHTHAEVLETEPLPPTVAAIVVSASPARAELERAIAAPELAWRWDSEMEDELLPAIAELGVTQFDDGKVRLGQVSRAVTGFLAGPLPTGEAAIRALVGRYFPSLATAPARLRGCPVSISRDRVPIAGPLPDAPSVWIVGGLAGPLVYLPALARRIAGTLAGEAAPELTPFSPARFTAETTAP